MKKLSLIIISLLILSSTMLLAQSPTTEPTKTLKQCMGKTKAGKQCLNHPMKGSEYCYSHQAQDPNASNQAKLAPTFQCGSPTKAGTPCKNRVKTKDTKCHLHNH